MVATAIKTEFPSLELSDSPRQELPCRWQRDAASCVDCLRVDEGRAADGCDSELPAEGSSGTFAAMNDDATADESALREPLSDEAELIAALRAGDEQAFERLLQEHGGPMLAVARRMLRNEADANDAVQDAFLSAFKSIDRFAGDAKLSTWLHRIVVNASLMKLRTKRRKPSQQIDDMLPQFLEDGHHASGVKRWRESVEDALDRKELSTLVRESIDSLPESHRTVLLLRDIEQRDTAETAELLEISEGAVKTRLHRARQALRELLNPYLEGEAL